jgi:hypothetical protein
VYAYYFSLNSWLLFLFLLKLLLFFRGIFTLFYRIYFQYQTFFKLGQVSFKTSCILLWSYHFILTMVANLFSFYYKVCEESWNYNEYDF